MARGINPRTLALQERRTAVARLYLRGTPQTEIGRELRVSQPTVSRDLEVLRQEWLAARLHDLDELKSRELARLDHIEREAWEQWERSKKDAVEVVDEGLRSGEPPADAPVVAPAPEPPAETVEELLQRKRRVKRAGQCGDSRYLQVAQRCVEERCKILGLYALPKQGALGGDAALEARFLALAEVLFARVIETECSPVVEVPQLPAPAARDEALR